jgi:hypothetical protein
MRLTGCIINSFGEKIVFHSVKFAGCCDLFGKRQVHRLRLTLFLPLFLAQLFLTLHLLLALGLLAVESEESLVLWDFVLEKH